MRKVLPTVSMDTKIQPFACPSHLQRVLYQPVLTCLCPLRFQRQCLQNKAFFKASELAVINGSASWIPAVLSVTQPQNLAFHLLLFQKKSREKAVSSRATSLNIVFLLVANGEGSALSWEVSGWWACLAGWETHLLIGGPGIKIAGSYYIPACACTCLVKAWHLQASWGVLFIYLNLLFS